MAIFKDRVVWITGAGTGIGRATAHMFARGGATLALFGRRPEPLEGVFDEVVRLGGHGLFQPVDVADRAGLEQARASVMARLGPAHILINNAGRNVRERSLDTVQGEAWDAVIAVNLTGAFNMVQAVLPAMRAQRDGLIVNIASVAGVRPSALAGAAYTASKHGMVGLSGTINEEEWGLGIRATALCPGEVNTPILEERPVPVPQVERQRMIQPDDVAEAVRFLAELHPRSHVPEMTLMPVHRRRFSATEGRG